MWSARWVYALTALILAGAIISTPSLFRLPTSMAQNSEETRLLRHVVLLQFKADASDAEVEKVVDAFRELPQKIDVIADFEYGTDNSPEGLANGFTHCFLVTFRSEKDRETYLPHPAHKAFVEVLKPHLEKVQVIDYWASR